MVKKLFIVLVSLWLATALFMPKERLYYALEHRLQEEHIELNEANIKEGIFSLVLEEVAMYVEGIHVINIEEVEFFTTLWSSRVEIQGVKVEKSLERMLPKEISSLTLHHTLLHPFVCSLEAEGTFGKAEGTIDLKTHHIHIDFVEEQPALKKIQSNLKKGEKGWYYESSF